MAAEVMQRDHHGGVPASRKDAVTEYPTSTPGSNPASSDVPRNQIRKVSQPVSTKTARSSLASPLPLHLLHKSSPTSQNPSPSTGTSHHIFPSSLPKLPPSTEQMASPSTIQKLRPASFTPETPPSAIVNDSTWIAGGTPGMHPIDIVRFQDFAGFGEESTFIGSNGWADEGGWEGLLDFGTDTKQDDAAPAFSFENMLSTTPSAQPMSRSRSDPASDLRPQQSANNDVSPPGAASASFSPSRVAQYGSDLAWKTILSSVVEVESIGETSVVRVLQEIWKRGGGDAVTAQSLWPSIIIALSLSLGCGAGTRLPTPSAHAAQALRELYTLTLRHWEPSIFSGLLASYASDNQSSHLPVLFGDTTSAPIADMSWMKATAGSEPLHLANSTGFTPRRSISTAFDFRFDADVRRSSLVRADGEDQARGIDEILAEMEEGREAHERAMVHAAVEASPKDAHSKGKRKSRPDVYQFPTPETDSTKSPSTRRPTSSEKASSHSPDSMASPFVTASSTTASIVSKILPAATRQPPPTSLMMPNATFVPPPPMCMFFSPAFKDLQKGKVGVWKGDLELRGRGGGKFSILIVGEEATGHLWQSNSWSSTIAYPSEITPNQSQGSCTSSMIPVSHLARDGFTPIAMGMVLCNDADVNPYVHMVQGLHAEGVAFHLPNPAGLPLVFLPAKFNATDPLQRLGIAFMSKPSVQNPIPTSTAEKSAPKRKRRRQSAPAKTLSGDGQRKKEGLAGLKGGIIEEEVIVE